jgi:creatinine amidohydrolase
MKTIVYADLTWPEVAALPRRLPLIIPVGDDDYDLRAAAAALRSDEIGVLPAVPFGFPRRGPLGDLAVGPGLMRRVLLGAARELRAQGFRRIAFLDGHGAARRLAGRGLRFVRGRIRRTRPGLPWPDLGSRVVVLTTGHTEQHGFHLPLETDTRIVSAIASGLSSASADRVVCLPAWPYGVSTHTRQFPGTLNLGGRTFEDFFLAIVGRLVKMGARAILFSNGHGGNHSFLVNVVKWAGERWPGTFTATEWLHTTGPALDQHRTSGIGGMGHGGELETSMMLHLRPEAVRMDRARRETDFIATPEYFMDWVEGGRLIANPPWTDDTSTGIYGDPTVATAKKGRLWLEAAVAERNESVDEILEQARRRREHRSSPPGG